MTVQITIVGLGQIGASAGLALAEHKSLLHRVGHDKEPEVAKKAQKMGAVDDIKFNLPSAVREAKIVLLSLPAHEMRATLEAIALDLPEGAVVMDTAPVKEAVAKWAQEILPEGRYYIGLAPAINPLYLQRSEIGVDAATADLFKNGLISLNALPGTPGEAVKLASDLIHLLGAAPLYGDMVETDGLMASTHLVPQLLAVALLNAIVDQPGWSDARKLAGRPFATLTSAAADQGGFEALTEAALLNQKNVTRVLDILIGVLSGLRHDIAEGDREGVADRIEQALAGRQRWLAERLSAEWSEGEKPDLSELPSVWERMLGSRKKRK
ncbi:MAG: prephenate dehydrogenase [Anaerolineales bacterium]|nr:prephenate dehydrogenase [Anaerolineales bacterium]